MTDVWGTTDVYAVGELTGNPQVLLDGQVLVGMNHDDDPKPDTPTMPIAWIKEYAGDEGKASRVFCTTMGAATDLRSDDLRRLLVNVAYWGMRMEDSIDPSRSVETVGSYDPTSFGFGTHVKGRRVSDYALIRSVGRSIAAIASRERRRPITRPRACRAVRTTG